MIKKGFNIYVEETNRKVEIHVFDEPLNKEIAFMNEDAPYYRFFIDEKQGSTYITFEIDKNNPHVAKANPSFGYNCKDAKTIH